MLKLGLTKDAPGAKWCKICSIKKRIFDNKTMKYQSK